jgi:hypothetical protein
MGNACVLYFTRLVNSVQMIQGSASIVGLLKNRRLGEGRMPMSICSLRWIAAAALFLAVTGGVNSRQKGKDVSPYRHGYYLFLVGQSHGCEDCYIPLLITRKSLEEMKSSASPEDCVLITTYERDSIWHNEGLLRLAQSDIHAAERKVSARNRTFRYQEISANEILKLLENPLGTIPISRTFVHSDLPAGPDLKELIADFRPLK